MTAVTHVIALLFCVSLCSECPNKHQGPVWQLRWSQQELSLTGEEKMEALFSVAGDGRFSKWFVSKNGLDCIGTVLCNSRWHSSLEVLEFVDFVQR